MLGKLIEWSARNVFIVVLATLALIGGGVYAVKKTPLDALPDLSDVQVIVYTPYAGQAPKVVEDQITYPLVRALQSTPHARTVRGYSMFGMSFVYVIFEEGTDLYWGRSRVLEYLSTLRSRLPEGVTPSLGPDATSVGWVFQYALDDRSGKHDLAELRALGAEMALDVVPVVVFSRLNPRSTSTWSRSCGSLFDRGSITSGARPGGRRITTMRWQ